MNYRYLGRSGLKISELSYGAWVTFGIQMDEQSAYQCMKEAYDAGVNFFDNAEVYANGEAEKIMGSVIKKAGWKRSDLIISTKIFWGGKGPNDRGLSRKHIIEGTNAALKRLQTDYVDLIFCHRPDYNTPIEETVWAMNILIKQGKALYWGTSEWTAERIRHAYEFAIREHLIPPLMEQPQYNMLERKKIEFEFVPLFKEIGLGTTTFSPLASGILTGKYNNGIPEGSRLSLDGYEFLRKRYEKLKAEGVIEKVKKLTEIAADLNATMSELAIAWILKNPNVSSVITGATKPEQVKQNMNAVNIVPKLTDEVMEKIENILDNKPSQIPDFREI